jgi:signal transduction histidine kinase
MIAHVNRLFHSFWSEPRPATVPRNIADWRLLAALVAVALLEVALRDDLGLINLSVLLSLALMPTILWRRSHPLLMAGIAFGATGAFEGAGLVTGRDVPDLNALVFLLILPYALFRWGSGREALLGLPIILVSATLGLARDELPAGEALGGIAILLAPIALGTAARYREAAWTQELEDVRSGERLSLARELHDTVAHHVSAIAVRAQAGVATSAQDPQAAVDALHVIGDEASRTLAEMREMVRVLRDDEVAELAPARRVEDLEGLTGGGDGRTRVEVELSGEPARLSPALSGAVYRLAQESVTNARRHARGATSIRVEVAVDGSSVTLRVQDDGEPATAGANPDGYGLTGMAERAQLLGGTLEAGPGPERGWMVTAVLPHGGAGAMP